MLWFRVCYFAAPFASKYAPALRIVGIPQSDFIGSAGSIASPHDVDLLAAVAVGGFLALVCFLMARAIWFKGVEHPNHSMVCGAAPGKRAFGR